MTVAGYTDSTGSEELNQKLSEKRAESVKNALDGAGVNPARITLSVTEKASRWQTTKPKQDGS